MFFLIFLLLYIIFKSATEAAVLIFPTLYAMSGGSPSACNGLWVTTSVWPSGSDISRCLGSQWRPESSWSCTYTKLFSIGGSQMANL